MEKEATGVIADAPGEGQEGSEAARTRKSESGLGNALPTTMTTRAMTRQAAGNVPAQGQKVSNAAKKRKAESELGNIPPTKKRRDATGVVAQGQAVSKAANRVAPVRGVPNQEKVATDVLGDKGDDEVQQEVADVQNQMSLLNRDIATNATYIEKTKKEIGEITRKLNLIDEFLMTLDNKDALAELFANDNKRWIKSIINATQRPDDQAEALNAEKKYLRDKETQLRYKETQLRNTQQILQNRLLLKEQAHMVGNTIFDDQSSKETDEFQSGLVYIEDKLRIEMVGHDSNGIGLLIMDNKGAVKVKENIKNRDISKMLGKAWAFTNQDFLTKKGVKEFCKLVPSLSEKVVTNACRGLLNEFEFDAKAPPGEMTFQQGICTPFAMLLMAAAGAKGLAENSYKADQQVFSSLSVQHKLKIDDHESVQKVLRIMPGSAATLFGDWDAFGMMEIKRMSHNSKGDLLDYNRCVLMTAVTAIAVRKCIEKEDYEKVLLPFLICKGHVASLYVTALNAEGMPVVLFVTYPDKSNSEVHVLSASPCIDRTKLFIAFAVLLNNFKNFFETFVKEKYMDKIKQRAAKLNNLPFYGLTERSAGRNTQEKDNEGTDGKPRSNQSRKTPEQYAKEAAEYAGLFSHLVNPFDIFMDFTENGIKDNAQTVSPFYFRGRVTLSGGETFLKVWKANEVDVHRVTEQWSYHNQAFKAGVPVAEPVLSELARSTCSRGFEYVLFATEFIHEDVIETTDDLWDFSCSLIEAMLMLHQKAKLLHGDIKRGNLRWNRSGVRLIDFEHAQEISNPGFAPGTKGYQAPEILEHMPCSKQTDTFSVGQTIFRELADFREWNVSCEENQKYIMLHELSARLTALHPDERWSLSQALFTMQQSQKTAQATIVVSLLT